MSEPEKEPPTVPAIVPEDAVQAVGKIAPEISSDKRVEIVRAVNTTTMMQFQGPVPPPELLAQYEKIVPGTADRLIKLTERQVTLQENQQAHRIAMESIIIPRQQTQSERGQHYGLTAFLFALIISALLVAYGHDTAGTILGSLDLVAVVAIFVTGKIKQSEDLSQKKNSIPESEDAE